ncbi:hypothetical protein [Mesobacillus foraminis]|uniref:hypothetical protein n=1 Tax=Mesobacillus foraminis TaxID=279826 RepID=UPI00288AEF5B|nr:hypothetical protein [Mesobacillus foraminis]
MKNHEMITDLTCQFEKSLTSIALLQSNIDGVNGNFQKEINTMKKLNSETEKKIENLYEEIQKDIKNLKLLNSGVEKRMDNLYQEINNNEKFANVIGEQHQQIKVVTLELNELQQEINDIKTKNREGHQNTTRNSNLFIGIGVVSAIILSIIGIIL